jgi:hypothetical protein
MNNFIVLICDMQVNSPITQTVIQITLFVDNQPKTVYTFFINLERDDNNVLFSQNVHTQIF